MAPSQLKRLKSSLRDQGLSGPSKSKKQKRNDQAKTNDSRVQRNAALQGIRDSFNPFEVKQASRNVKFQVTNANNINGRGGERAKSRPGVARSLGEEVRKRTLLPEMQRRNKSGGLIDRRIGEDDPSMNPEDRALQRYARERLRNKGSMFDLEVGDDDDGGLTHGGKALDLNGMPITDDYDDQVEERADDPEGEEAFLKRRFMTMDDAVPIDSDGDADTGEPARKKTRTEVMKEVMAKSKLHKYERQKAKEDDDDLRDELDKGLSDLMGLLAGHKPARPAISKPDVPAEPSVNPARLALMNGTTRTTADKQYDSRMRQMALDARAVPAERTKTADEKAADEAKRLKQLEESRQRRMKGQPTSDDDDDAEEADTTQHEPADVENGYDDAAEFGFSASVPPPPKEQPLVLDEEDDFELDDDLIASGSDSDVDMSGSDSEESDPDSAAGEEGEDDEDDFVQTILGDKAPSSTRPDDTMPVPKPSDSVAFVYDCPATHADFLKIVSPLSPSEIPTIIQRIRAATHSSLAAENKPKLAQFAGVLIDHIAYMANNAGSLPLIETIIRHIHSLSRSSPLEIATHFRTHLASLHERGTPTAGDLVVLTAISTIYPTSDHFHQVVTPAMTLMARWLGLTRSCTQQDHVTGAALIALILRYQKLSKRFVPEVIRFSLRVLATRPLACNLSAYVANLAVAAEQWASQAAFTEIFAPVYSALQDLQGSLKDIPTQQQQQEESLAMTIKKAISTLRIQLNTSSLSRRPQELHHHKPQAIRSSYPKFEESFNPNSHYDPDKQRTESARLAKEVKRERKGAMRDLRKDAQFVARTQLAEKKERDAEYEKKYKRLVAEIQGEEGREAKDYERVKRMRKSAR